jgi:hypothetical protein
LSEPIVLKEKKAGRKYVMASSILGAGTLVMLFPSLLAWLGVPGLPALMTGGEFVSLAIGVFAMYVGGNVAQKKVMTDAKASEEE